MKKLLQKVTILTALCLLGQASSSAKWGNIVQQNPPKDAIPAQTDEEKRLNRTPEITIPAEREVIIKILKKQMKEAGYRLIKQEEEVLVFDQRTPGAAAAERRNSYNRTTMTPIIDDPRTIMAFGITPKKKEILVVARLVVTTVIQSEVFQRDVTDKKEARVTLNKVLEQLKAEASNTSK